MKVVGVIGYKESGNTTLIAKLVKELQKRGYKVATTKHCHEGIDLPNKDTQRHGANLTLAISERESALFFKEERDLEDMLRYVEADYVIVEGFKELKSFPKIVCLRNKNEAATLLDGLEIGIVASFKDDSLPILEDPSQIVDLVEEKAFKLPSLNCQACGFESCYELAKEIVKGNKRVSDCPALESKVVVEIGGEKMPLNPFTSGLIENTIRGLLSSLKGYKKGDIRIEIPF